MYFYYSTETLAVSVYSFGIKSEISLESITFKKKPFPSTYFRVFALTSLRYCLAITREKTLL